MNASDLALIFGLFSVACTVIGYGGEFLMHLFGG